MFTATACLFWWTLLRGRFGRSGYGIAVLFVFATALHSGGLGALAALSTRPWYETYSHRAPTGSNPLGDQQLAGLIMWVPTCALLTVIGLALFAAWLGESERRRRIGGLG